MALMMLPHAPPTASMCHAVSAIIHSHIIKAYRRNKAHNYIPRSLHYWRESSSRNQLCNGFLSLTMRTVLSAVLPRRISLAPRGKCLLDAGRIERNIAVNARLIIPRDPVPRLGTFTDPKYGNVSATVSDVPFFRAFCRWDISDRFQ